MLSQGGERRVTISGELSALRIGLTDRKMQDFIGQVGAWRRRRPCCAQSAPMYDDGNLIMSLDVPLEDRLSKTLSWLSDWRRAGVFG